MKEILNLMKDQNAFLLNSIYCGLSEHHWFHVQEYPERGTLKKYIGNGAIKEKAAKFYSSCIVLAIEFLHFNNIMHRNITLENVVVDGAGFAKLSDFHHCKANMKLNDTIRTVYKDDVYKAPEMAKSKGYTKGIDWFALGVCLHYMALGSFPNYSKNTLRHRKKLSNDSNSLISELIESKPDVRLGNTLEGTESVKNHRFFKSVDWENLRKRNIEPPIKPKLDQITYMDSLESDFSIKSDRFQNVFRNFDL